MTSPTASQLEQQWAELTDDLIEHAGGKTGAQLQRLQTALTSLGALIKSGPSASQGNLQRLSEIMNKQLSVVQKLQSSTVKEDKERFTTLTTQLEQMLEKTISSAQNNLTKAASDAMSSTSFGKMLAKEALKAQRQEEKAFRQGNHSERRETLKMQLREILELQRSTSSDDQRRALNSFRMDLIQQMSNISKGNLQGFKALESRLSNLDDYGLSGFGLDSRLSQIEAAATRKLERRRAITSGVGRFAMGAADQLGLGGLARLGVSTYKGGKVVGRGLSNVSSAISSRLSQSRSTLSDAMNDRNEEELLRRQVTALERLSESNRSLARKSGDQGRGLLSGLMDLKGLSGSILSGLSSFLGLRGLIGGIATGLGGLARFLVPALTLIGKGLGIGLLGAGVDALANLGADSLDAAGHTKSAKAARTAGTTAAYAATGAVLGSVIPGVGTLAGGVLGGAIGLGKGIYDNWGSSSATPVPSSSAVSTGGSVSNNAYTTRAGVDMGGLDPSVRANFEAMAAEYKASGGQHPIRVNSAKRSFEEQARLYAANPRLAAPPGSSSHETGLAIDIDRAAANDMARMGLLGKYGFGRPVSNEPWHLQAAGTAKGLAKSGVMSADLPQNQSGLASSIGRGNGVPVRADTSVPVTSSGGGSFADGVTGSAVRAPGATLGPANQGSVSSIPSLSFMDQGFFLMNVGALAS